MRSTFMGLEINKSGLFLQQSALYTTGHNIANANTLGYSRQRVNMQALPGYPSPGLNSPKMPGHLGTGAEAHSVQRVRDEFIDRQYRQETNKLGYWEEQTKAIEQMEDILSEPSEFGINKSFDNFWQAMEDVVANSKDTAARQVLIAKARALAESFNYTDKQLKTVQSNLGAQIEADTNTVNSLLRQIAEINRQIMAVEPNGYVTNDLYDARDVLVDKLNEYLPVQVERVPSGGNASPVSEGSLTITYRPVGSAEPIILVHGKEFAEISINNASGKINGTEPLEPFTEMLVDWKGSALADIVPPIDKLNSGAVLAINESYDYSTFEPGKGKLLSNINSYGHSNGQGLYPEMLDKLDQLVETFVTTFNALHQSGYGLNDSTGQDFFEAGGLTAATIKVRDDILPEDIAASSELGEQGNNKNILDMAKSQTEVQVGLNGATYQGFFKSMIGDLGVRGEEAIRSEYNSGTLRLSVENKRAAMSSVSLDEEMTNMIMFQQAYNANARMITVVDETLDKIINGMGRVGL
ncbi:flagellar hook-associated protein FlgK [Metasolibacillus sp. FSL H7-0170]|uniref:flagellar hook-associated protein FlgK n=1 Tax=Metasolibacillus sp. FSL H7-0170 TaxID=2921431 RepID=UPI0007938C88|nr:flagellar hook-associated protein FlgK [[Bacillus] sp. KCTC 13219]